MNIIAPNFVSVRLDEQDRQNFAKVSEGLSKAIGTEVNTATLYRAAIKALAEKFEIKGVK